MDGKVGFGVAAFYGRNPTGQISGRATDHSTVFQAEAVLAIREGAKFLMRNWGLFSEKHVTIYSDSRAALLAFKFLMRNWGLFSEKHVTIYSDSRAALLAFSAGVVNYV